MPGNIAVTPPDLVFGCPPASKRIAAGEIVCIDHSPVTEGPFVGAPTPVSILRRAKIAAGPANPLDTVGRQGSSRTLGAWAIDRDVIVSRHRLRGKKGLISELVGDRREWAFWSDGVPRLRRRFVALLHPCVRALFVAGGRFVGG